jgi:general secretion pathway protein D
VIIRPMKSFRFHIIFSLVFLVATAALSGAEKTYRLEADNKPLDEFLKEVAKITGKNFLLDPAVKGTVSFVSPKPLTKEEVWDLAKSALDINGFTVVEHQAIIKVIPKEAAAHHPVPTLGPTQIPMAVEGFVTALIPLNYISPEQAIESVRILVGPHGKIASSPGKPGVVIIDTEANIARIRKLISRFDVKSARLQVDVIHLKWADAGEVAQALTELFLKTGGVKGVGSASRFTSEERSNSIIIRAPFIDGKAAKGLALKLDQQDSGITVRKLRDMDAESARQLLDSLVR